MTIVETLEIESDVHSEKFDNLAKIALKEFESETTVLLGISKDERELHLQSTK